MRSLGPATIRVTAVAGGDVDLDWLRLMMVPVGVEVEVAELGERVDIAIRRRDEEVGVVINLTTGAQAMETNGHPESPLAQFGLWFAAVRRLAADAASPKKGDETALKGEYFRPASVRWPLPSAQPPLNSRGGLGHGTRSTGRRSVRFRAGRSLRGRAMHGR